MDHRAEQDEGGEESGGAAEYIFGALSGMLGSVAYALMYVLTEKIQKAADAPPPEALCVFVGMIGTAVLIAYIAVWDGPSWDNMVNDQLTGSYGDIVAVYFAIVVCCFLHNLAFFHLTRLSASATACRRPFSELYCIVTLIVLAAFQAVMAGINKAVQAVSVFAVSHKFYCDIDAQQCLTAGKVTAMAMVVAGVLLFSFGKKWCACPPRRTETNVDSDCWRQGSGHVQPAAVERAPIARRLDRPSRRVPHLGHRELRPALSLGQRLDGGGGAVGRTGRQRA